MKISPELIPHTEFHKGIWLLPVKGSDWYYFMRRSNNLNRITEKRFIKTVDKPLRKLVRFLHTRGVRTTPSCSGHHITERNLEKIYDSLLKDADEIRTKGLKFKDVESGEVFFLKDKNYSLPWSKDEFIEKVSLYQQKGLIGIRFGKYSRARSLVINSSIEGTSIVESDGIVFIFTNEDNKGDNRRTWHQVTQMVKRAFGTITFKQKNEVMQGVNAVLHTA